MIPVGKKKRSIQHEKKHLLRNINKFINLGGLIQTELMDKLIDQIMPHTTSATVLCSFYSSQQKLKKV